MSRFADRKPVNRQPKSITVRVGIFRIVRGLDEWVVLGKHGKFAKALPLLMEAEQWARDETSRLAQLAEQRMAEEARKEAEAYTELSMRAGESGMTVYEYTGGEQPDAEDLLEQHDYMV